VRHKLVDPLIDPQWWGDFLPSLVEWINGWDRIVIIEGPAYAAETARTLVTNRINQGPTNVNGKSIHPSIYPWCHAFKVSLFFPPPFPFYFPMFTCRHSVWVI